MELKFKNTERILEKLKLEDDGVIQAFFTDTCKKHMDKYVPKDIGVLRDSAFSYIDHITYEQPYAEYQYKGQRRDGSRKISHWTTPRNWTILGQENEKCRNGQNCKGGSKKS